MLSTVRERERPTVYERRAIHEYPALVYPEIKNILFATDFSHCSACTLECLRGLAGLHGSTIRVVHVVPPRRDQFEPLPGLSGIHSTQAKVPKFLERHPITNVPYEVWTAHGPIGDTLISLARRENMDMIALGARGHRKAAPGLGLIADQIVSAAPCPVFTAAEHDMRHRREGIERVMFATDFSPASLHALPYALSLASKTGAQLLLVYVDTPEASADYLVEAAYEGKLLNLVPHEAGLHNIEPIVTIGATWKGILDTAAEHAADIIVMGSPLDAPRHSSAIHAMAHCPVLSVP